MLLCRTIIAIGCLGSVCLLVGCGVVPGDANGGADDFLSAGVDGFSADRPLVVEADKATSQLTNVSLPGDLLEDAPEDAALALNADDITVTVNGESSGRKNPAAKAASHHASITFRFGPRGQNACDSDDTVGPFELTVENGVVTLAEESLPLDARARSSTRNGKFEICTETWADFDGSISLARVSFEFGQLRGDEQRVVLCHVPSGNSDNAHAITVGASAVDAHLGHGDYVGACDGSDASTDNYGEDGNSAGDGDDNHDDPGSVDEDGTDGEEDDDPDDNAEADGGDADDETTEADDLDDNDEDDVNDDEDGVTGGGGGSAGAGGAGGAGGGGGRTPSASGDDKAGREKVVICHMPPGNPDNRHTITVSEAAVEAHLAHGDVLGECDEDEGEPDVEDEDKDSDGDGVLDDADACPDTPTDEAVDEVGCSCSQKDADSDGVMDCDDQCSGTAPGAEVDAHGCSCAQLGNCANECQADADCIDDLACAEYLCVAGRCVFQFEGHVRFVDSSASGANDGNRWEDAYVDLQDALAEATANERIAEIWVASAGGSPYTPAGPGGSRYVSFALKNCLAIYGGFVGGEVFRDERDPKANVTILSGDLNGDDDAATIDESIWWHHLNGGGNEVAGGGLAENSYHVVWADYHGQGQYPGKTSVLDGFTITAGNADGVYPQNFGGGMFSLAGSPTVRNCRFVGNTANSGGGMAIRGGSPTVRNCVFVSNTAMAGAGIHSGNTRYYDPPTVADCSFIENVAFESGGGLYASNGALRLVRSQFVGNSAGSSGGGVVIWGSGDLMVTLTDCLLSRNWAGYNGGAIWSVGSTLALRNVTIASNASGSFGGGLYVSLEAPAIPNPVVSNAKSVVSNCVFWNNHDSSGETETSQIYSPEGEGNPLVSYTLMQGLDLYAAGTGNIGQNPLFVSDNNLRLQADSPAINAGDPGTVLEAGETDLDGKARVLQGRIDMGTYEFSTPGG